MVTRLITLVLAATAAHGFHVGLVPGLRSSRCAPSTSSCPLSMSVVPSSESGERGMTRASFLIVGGLSVLTTLAQPALATPVRAPLPRGKADPKDKEKLEKAAVELQGLEDKVKDPKQWDSVIKVIDKEQYSQDGMETMFLRAAMSLPKNQLLGTDAGIWSGVRVEALQAMESFQVELRYLNDEKAKSKKEQDTEDLERYYQELNGKVQEFLALYGDVRGNKYLKAYGIEGEGGEPVEEDIPPNTGEKRRGPAIF
mmetsp:Transcript_42873/g.99603  ORF Transcript_42873/g.99603 Transcript_42873/m.99603 type:complete len:255 (-) Transcript_42873:34-798(-)